MKIKLRKSKTKILQLFFTGMLYAISPAIFAQTTTRQLSLEEAIQLSLSNSHVLQASKARIEQASAGFHQAKERRLPDASASGAYLRLASPNISLNTGKSGGSPDSSGSAMPAVHQAMYGVVNVSLPLFTGGKLKYGIESAKFLEQAAVLDAANDSQAVISNTIDAYANLYKSGVTADVVKENLASSKYRDSVFLRLENNGLLARNDRLKAQLQTSNIELSLFDAQNNFRIATVNMNLMLGLPEDTRLITDSLAFQVATEIPGFGELEQLLENNRKDLLALQERESAAKSAISLTRANFYPNIALTGGYIAAYVPNVLTVTNAMNAGIGFQYDIGSLWKTKSKVAEARARLQELEANEAAMRDAIRLDLERNFENFLLQQKKITVYQNAVSQAEENYRISKNKFNNQLLNTTDLLDANLLLLQSKINLAVARADLYVTRIKVLQSAGISLQ